MRFILIKIEGCCKGNVYKSNQKDESRQHLLLWKKNAIKFRVSGFDFLSPNVLICWDQFSVLASGQARTLVSTSPLLEVFVGASSCSLLSSLKCSMAVRRITLTIKIKRNNANVRVASAIKFKRNNYINMMVTSAKGTSWQKISQKSIIFG